MLSISWIGPIILAGARIGTSRRATTTRGDASRIHVVSHFCLIDPIGIQFNRVSRLGSVKDVVRAISADG